MAKAKKAFAFFLALAMFTCSFLSVSAQTNQEQNPLICYGSTDEIQPRLKYFDSVFAGVSLKDGKVVATGDYTSYASGIDVTLLVNIEKQSGSNWTIVKSNSQTYSPGFGSNMLGTTLTSPTSGTYRGAVTALAINSKGTIVETIIVRTTKTVTV